MKSTLQHNLTYILANYSSLPDSITQLEERNLPLVESLKVFQGSVNRINKAYGDVGKAVSDKCAKVIKNIPGYEKKM